MLVRPYKFQKEVREALAPEWEVEFISDDIWKMKYLKVMLLFAVEPWISI
ncbi:hypothetical protein ACE4XI_04535 [Enterococcus avium]|nr:hypothetical protein [Enterococcus avium]MDT2475150.1 hypothetical protein [Enterococcus avium]